MPNKAQALVANGLRTKVVDIMSFRSSMHVWSSKVRREGKKKECAEGHGNFPKEVLLLTKVRPMQS